MRFALVACLLLAGPGNAQAPPGRDQVLAAMRKAANFFAGKVSTNGGYHFYYTDDLSYGRSEQAEGPTQIEVQREATPRAGMAFLEAYDATGDRLFLDAARKAATALIRGQLCSGGWDYIVEFDPDRRRNYPYRTEHDCTRSSLPSPRPTTLDDNVTQAAVRLLMRVDRALDFKDQAIHEAVLFALDSLARAQYPNGAWPQRFSSPPDASKFPVRQAGYPDEWPRKWPGVSYQNFYTFNDNTISDAIDMMLEAARIYREPRYLASAEKGGDFILLAQMPDPQPAWAQQYDAGMHPAWARQFEPPSITAGESQGILKTLMVLYRETGKRKYLDAVPRALAWLERSILPPVSSASSERRRRAAAGPVLARFYELKTNRPLFISKGTQITARGLGSARIDGYELTYSDESVITHYALHITAAQLPGIRAEYERLAAASDPATLRRPDSLHGLSPWAEGDRSPLEARPDASTVRALLDSMDDRGAWTEEGIIGRPDRIVSVFAARDMVLTINGKPAAIRPGDRIELYQGALPPRTRIIRTATFARNLETLSAWLHAGNRASPANRTLGARVPASGAPSPASTPTMDTFFGRINAKGQLVIPPRLREELKICPGVPIAMHREEDRLVLQSVTDEFIQSVPVRLKRVLGKGPSLTEELLSRRRREFARE